MHFTPVYKDTYKKGKLDEFIGKAFLMLADCRMCPRNCGIDRNKETSKFCKTGVKAKVACYGPHFGEENPLVGIRGSGTIFFSSCNLLCSFCQNFDISHQCYGKEVSSYELADIMLYLQDMGCHNINLVTPTHVVAQILASLKIAIEKGLSIPLVYNSSGYEKASTIELLDGIIDIYMPDFKFWNPDFARRTCNAPDYHIYASESIKEMYRQVGDLELDDFGVARKGLLLRHLVMPEKLANSELILDFIALEISGNTYINIMDQYRPCYRASEEKPINRSISPDEYVAVVNYAKSKGLYRLD